MTFKTINQCRYHISFSILVVSLILTSAACKRSAQSNANGDTSTANSSVPADNTSSTPPFPTKEPERYQATMVTSGSIGGQSANVPGLSTLTNQRMLVSRDGEKRRVETEMLPGIKIIYLQLASGRYMLYPAKKLYSEVKLDGSDASSTSTSGVPSDFAPNKLINAPPAGAKYEKLGTEVINGRTTTKYKVSTGGDGSQAASETIIWADETLGMPIKVESTSKDGAKFTMEMLDIKEEVDSTIFDLPKDYKKVGHEELLSSAIPTLTDIFGNGKEKKKTDKR